MSTSIVERPGAAFRVAESEGCVGYVDLPDGSTGPGCDHEPVAWVETLCDGGERVDGPACGGHFMAVRLTRPLDCHGHRVTLLAWGWLNPS